MIKFYNPKNPFGFLSNFSDHPIRIDGKTYPTSEHYYQSQKFLDDSIRNQVASTASPSKAAKMGRDTSLPLRSDWEIVKNGIMKKVLRCKVEQHYDVISGLLSTGEQPLVEDSPIDYYWGIGKDGSGQNWLGKLWMEIREEVRAGIKNYTEAPNELPANRGNSKTVFLAGGISGTREWQDQMTLMLDDPALWVVNPRRKHFPSEDNAVKSQQIEWEFRHLAISDMILFWFPAETLCPITLYELGRCSALINKPIFVGCNENYKRSLDVRIQMSLARPEIKVVSSLIDLSEQVLQYIRGAGNEQFSCRSMQNK